MARGLPGTHGGGARPGGRQGGDCRARQHDTATQEAADLLGVSRLTFVKILDEGGLSYTRPGRHRRSFWRTSSTTRRRDARSAARDWTS
ncbi:excisionase family DNA-binding protein [Streptomyces cavourensis]|uniref:excisionase family DNA-binding protein n=1 Tax=Streptomyces cavourensis TaxID=67258 RepID=UPI001E47F192|nr:excisionase family DNA-binding protein [Streptomyces cavourensis]